MLLKEKLWNKKKKRSKNGTFLCNSTASERKTLKLEKTLERDIFFARLAIVKEKISKKKKTGKNETFFATIALVKEKLWKIVEVISLPGTGVVVTSDSSS